MFNKFLLQEGLKPLIILSMLTLFFYFIECGFLSFLFLMLTLFVGYVFRNSSRYIHENSKSVLSPIDGKVIAIDTINGKTKIYCKVSLCGDHTVRAPFTSSINIKKFQHGVNLHPNSEKAKLLNEQIVVKFDDLKIRFISGLCNITLQKPEAQSYQQGDSVFTFVDGMVVITIKNTNKLLLTVGEKLLSGQTILFKR